MTDTKAPKRIWAAAYSHGGVRANTVFHVGTNVDVYAFEQKEYIRSDLYNKLMRAADELANAAERQFDSLNAWLRNPDPQKAKISIKADDAFTIALTAYQQAKENTND